MCGSVYFFEIYIFRFTGNSTFDIYIYIYIHTVYVCGCVYVCVCVCVCVCVLQYKVYLNILMLGGINRD